MSGVVLNVLVFAVWGSAVGAISLTGLFAIALALAAGCSRPGSSTTTPRVARVFAHVRGVT